MPPLLARVVVLSALVLVSGQTVGDLFEPESTPFTTTSINVVQVELADVDGDGDLDFVATIQAGTVGMAWWENAGSDGVTTVFTDQLEYFHVIPIPQLATNNVPFQFEVTDIDNDGDLDVVYVIPDHQGLSLMQNTLAQGTTDKNALFQAGQQVWAVPSGTLLTLSVADVNDDGFKDVAVLNSDIGIGPQMFLNTQDPANVFFGPSDIINAADAQAAAFGGLRYQALAPTILLADVTGDGRPDCITADSSFGIVYYHEWVALDVSANGYGFAANRQVLFADPYGFNNAHPFGAAVADLNGDTYPDVVLALSGLNFGSGGSGAVVYVPSTNATSPTRFGPVAPLTAGDFALLSAPVYIGRPTTEVEGYLQRPRTLRLHDITGDGAVDVFVASEGYGGAVALFVNDGSGGFGDGFFSSGGGVVTSQYNRPRSLAIGDVDGDGDVDVATADQLGTNMGIVFNVATFDAVTPSVLATLTPVANLPSSGGTTADFDGDGIADTVATTVDGVAGNQLGFVAFGSLTPLVSSFFVTFSEPKIMDVDGDGMLDIAYMGTSPSINDDTLVGYLRNNGAGFDAPHKIIAFPGAGAAAPGFVGIHFDVGDFTGDGRPDVAVAYDFSGTKLTITVAGRADAPSGFDPADAVVLQDDLANFAEPVFVAIVDLTGDGAKDLVVVSEGGTASSGAPAVNYYVNTNGVLATSVSTVESDFTSVQDVQHAALADVDGDGDIDVVVALSDGIVWLRSLLAESSSVAFAPTSVSVSTLQDAAKVHTTDYDGDGFTDVVVLDGASNRVVFYRHTGAACDARSLTTCVQVPGTMFGSFEPLQSGLSNSRFLSVVDVDGDGDTDIDIFPSTGNITRLTSSALVAVTVNAGTGNDATCAPGMTTPCATIEGALRRTNVATSAVRIIVDSVVSLSEPVKIVGTLASRPVSITSSSNLVGLDCSALSQACIQVADGASVTMTDVQIGGGTGGAISVSSATLTMLRCGISGVTNTDDGGAISATSSTLTIRDSAFTLVSSTGAGGAIFARDSTLSVLFSSFTTCTASTTGGAISVVATSPFNVAASTADISTSSFTSCSAGSGGALYAEGSTATVSGSSSFTTCMASTGFGGGVYVSKSSVLQVAGVSAAFPVTSTGCTAASSGGFLASDLGSLVTLSSLSVQTAHAAVNGGGIYVSGSENLVMTDVTTTSCEASSGGGVYVIPAPNGASNLTTVVAVTCVAAGGNGGGFFWEPVGTTSSLAADTFGCSQCSAPGGGGGCLFVNEAPNTAQAYTIATPGFSGNTALYGADVAGPAFTAQFVGSEFGETGATSLDATIHTGVALTGGLARYSLLDRGGQEVVADNATLCRLSVTADTGEVDLEFPETYFAQSGSVTLTPFQANQQPFDTILDVSLVCGTMPAVDGTATVDSLVATVEVPPPAVSFPSTPDVLELPLSPPPVMAVRSVTSGDPVAFDDAVCEVEAVSPATATVAGVPVGGFLVGASGNITLAGLLVRDTSLGSTVNLRVNCRRTEQTQSMPPVMVPVALRNLEVVVTQAPPATVDLGAAFPVAATVRVPGGMDTVTADDYTRCTLELEPEAGGAAAEVVGGTTVAADGVLTFPSVSFAGRVGVNYTAAVACTVGGVAVPTVTPPSTVAVSPCPAGSAPTDDDLSCEACPLGTFSGDGLSCNRCQPGTYGDLPGMVRCLLCPRDTFSEDTGADSVGDCLPCSLVVDGATVTLSTGSGNSTHCVCRDGWYDVPTTPPQRRLCQECTTGMDCRTLGLTISTLRVLPGFWRASSSLPSTTLPCREPSLCVGSDARNGTTGEALCHEHHTGPLCELCSEGFSKGSNVACGPCSGGGPTVSLTPIGVAVTVGFSVAVLVAIARRRACSQRLARLPPCRRFNAAKRKKALREASKRADSIWARSRDAVSMWKLLVSYMQVALVVVVDYGAEFSAAVQEAVKPFSALFIDVPSLIDVNCNVEWDQLNRLQLVTLLPLSILGAIGAVHVCLRWAPATPTFRESMRRRLFSLGLLLAFVVYPAVCAEVAKTKDCMDVGDTTTYLRADVSIPCTFSSERYRALVVYSVVMGVVFVVGVPAVVLVALWRHRQLLFPGNRDRLVVVTHSDFSSTVTVHTDKLGAAHVAELHVHIRACAWQLEALAAGRRVSATALMDAQLCPNVERRSGSPTDAAAAGCHFVLGATCARGRALVEAVAQHWHAVQYDMAVDVEARNKDSRVTHLEFLYWSFEPRFWYFEVVELVRKFVLTGGVVLLFSDVAARLTFAMLFTMMSTMVLLALKPYRKNTDDVVAVVLSVILYLTLLAGLMNVTGVVSDSPALDAATVALQVLVPLGAVAGVTAGCLERRYRGFVRDKPARMQRVGAMSLWQKARVACWKPSKASGAATRPSSMRLVQNPLHRTAFPATPPRSRVALPQGTEQVQEQ